MNLNLRTTLLLLYQLYLVRIIRNYFPFILTWGQDRYFISIADERQHIHTCLCAMILKFASECYCCFTVWSPVELKSTFVYQLVFVARRLV